MDKVFKVFNILVMIFGGILILASVLMVFGSWFLTSDAGSVTSGGISLMMLLVLLPTLIAAVLSFLAGYAGTHSDPDKCKRYSMIIVILLVISAVSALRNGNFGFMTVVELAFYGFYCYLAHTQFY